MLNYSSHNLAFAVSWKHTGIAGQQGPGGWWRPLCLLQKLVYTSHCWWYQQILLHPVPESRWKGIPSCSVEGTLWHMQELAVHAHVCYVDCMCSPVHGSCLFCFLWGRYTLLRIQPNSDMMNVFLLYKPRHDMRVFIELSHSSIGSQLFIIIYSCVVWLNLQNVSISFINNTASTAGAAFYASSVRQCSWLDTLTGNEATATETYSQYTIFTPPEGSTSPFTFKWAWKASCLFVCVLQYQCIVH